MPSPDENFPYKNDHTFHQRCLTQARDEPAETPLAPASITPTKGEILSSNAIWYLIYVISNICHIDVYCTSFNVIQRLWGQHGAHLGPTRLRWAPCWPHEPCYMGDDIRHDMNFSQHYCCCCLHVSLSSCCNLLVRTPPTLIIQRL